VACRCDSQMSEAVCRRCDVGTASVTHMDVVSLVTAESNQQSCAVNDKCSSSSSSSSSVQSTNVVIRVFVWCWSHYCKSLLLATLRLNVFVHYKHATRSVIRLLLVSRRTLWTRVNSTAILWFSDSVKLNSCCQRHLTISTTSKPHTLCFHYNVGLLIHRWC